MQWVRRPSSYVCSRSTTIQGDVGNVQSLVLTASDVSAGFIRISTGMDNAEDNAVVWDVESVSNPEKVLASHMQTRKQADLDGLRACFHQSQATSIYALG